MSHSVWLTKLVRCASIVIEEFLMPRFWLAAPPAASRGVPVDQPPYISLELGTEKCHFHGYLHLVRKCAQGGTAFSNTSKGCHCEEQCDTVQSITVVIIIHGMKEKLTFWVSELPELYNSNLWYHWDSKKPQAWQKMSEKLGMIDVKKVWEVNPHPPPFCV